MTGNDWEKHEKIKGRAQSEVVWNETGEISHVRMKREVWPVLTCREGTGSCSPESHNSVIGPEFYRTGRRLPSFAFTAGNFHGV